MSLKIIVVDDESPVCSLISSLIDEFDDCEVVAQTSDSTKILELVDQYRPDVVFTDINMPGMDGLTLAHRLQREHPGVGIVYISGHANFASDAYNLDVIDFIVKPLSRGRLEKTMEKILRFKHMTANLNNGFCQNKLALKNGHGLTIVDLSRIYFIEKCGTKCIVHTHSGTYETTETLAALEKKLNGSKFFRCHKSFLINIDNVEKVAPYADRAYEVTFQDYARSASMRRDKFEEFALLVNPWY